MSFAKTKTLLSILSLVETSHCEWQEAPIQKIATIFDEWLLTTVDVHDPQTHRGVVPNCEAFVSYILLFVECRYFINTGWVVKPQPKRVICCDCSLD